MSQGKAGPQYTEIVKQAMIVGRNQTPVPPDEVELMAKIGCTDREIAEHFGLSESTLRYNFSDFLIKGRSELKQKLRKAQLRVAFEGNATLLIWLGKQILGQTDSPLQAGKEPLPFTDDDLDGIDASTEDNSTESSAI